MVLTQGAVEIVEGPQRSCGEGDRKDSWHEAALQVPALT